MLVPLLHFNCMLEVTHSFGGQDSDITEKSKCLFSENYACHSPVSQQSTDSGDEFIQLRKLNGSPGECPSRQNLHKELLLSHKRGLLEEKPELKRVLQQRRLDLHREEELALQPPSDLEQELRKRQQKLQEYEMEEQRRIEDEKNVPEFVRVKENLRRIQLTE
ncbi:hypothetical protein cypCar_00021143 [Cyprinus carpio]|nr:hypothetical protein cypCar_00021143 [Cyprinus carpio]